MPAPTADIPPSLAHREIPHTATSCLSADRPYQSRKAHQNCRQTNEQCSINNDHKRLHDRRIVPFFSYIGRPRTAALRMPAEDMENEHDNGRRV